MNGQFDILRLIKFLLRHGILQLLYYTAMPFPLFSFNHFIIVLVIRVIHSNARILILPDVVDIQLGHELLQIVRLHELIFAREGLAASMICPRVGFILLRLTVNHPQPRPERLVVSWWQIN